MKNEIIFEDSEYNIRNSKRDRVLKFDDDPNANSNYPNLHKKFTKKIQPKIIQDNEKFNFFLFWNTLIAFVLLICVLYFFFFVGFPVKRANILVSEFGII
jgi:hypothetical protein